MTESATPAIADRDKPAWGAGGRRRSQVIAGERAKSPRMVQVVVTALNVDGGREVLGIGVGTARTGLLLPGQ